MNHLGTAVLDTPRLLLRPFTMEDAGAAFRNWTGDAAVTEFLRWPAYPSVETTEQVLADWIARYERPDFYQWAIVLKDSPAVGPMGTISVVEQREDLALVHIGYCIGRPWWRRGITSEALAALLPFFFGRVGVNRIESQHDPENPGSGRVMEKCGLVYEGTHRGADVSNRGIVDAAVYGLLAADFRIKRTGDENR